MNKLSLQLITDDNLNQVIKLSDTLSDYQKGCVAPNMYSIAEAYVNPGNAWPRAIYLDDKPIGFVMLSLTPDEIEEKESYYLWRYMIAADYQNKGYGKAVLDLIVNKCKEDKKEYLYTSCEMKGDMPYQFYLKYGFIDTGVVAYGEEVLKLEVKLK
ncbi:MAG: GNAT family N-acetyltransferase [Tenericutes bacterium]|nr:GNAT family N-acetyltransferase [Mycoplasmatota bacterium]